MEWEQAIPSWASLQRLFDVFKDASLEVITSVAFGFVGFALFRSFGKIPWFSEKEGRKHNRMWIPALIIPLLVGGFSAWRYWHSMTPAKAPAVRIDPQEYIFYMTLLLAVFPGFIVMPVLNKIMKKRGSDGNTEIIERKDGE